MAGGTAPTLDSQIDNDSNQGYTKPFITVTFLFFMWGFITVMNDVLIPHLKEVFELNYLQAMFIQFATFGAYGLMSYPSGWVISKVGYKHSMVLGLVVSGIGCLLFFPAAEYNIYGFFLGALLVLFSGVTLLQVSANPYISVLGKPEKASVRLNLAQGFNSLGTTLGPVFGTYFILTSAVENSPSADAVQGPYLGLAATFFALAIFIYFSGLPKIGGSYAAGDDSETQEKSEEERKGILKYPHLLLGVVGIFMYVGAEVSVGSFIVNFLEELGESGVKINHLINLGPLGSFKMTEGYYLSFYWGGLMVGRFAGSALMGKIKPALLLTVFAAINVLLLILVISSEGNAALWSVVAVGLFNSIGFPTIFTLAIADLGKLTSKGSSLLVMAIVGGAIIPPVQGFFADLLDVQTAFFVPILCYIYISFYGLVGHKLKPKD